jgi:ribokinase
MTGMPATTTRVLVVGDANPDLVLRGDVVPRFGQAEQLLDEAALVIGGSAAITAHALARLDRPVSLAAAVGTDAFAAGLREQLSAAGVDLLLSERPDMPTGLSVILGRGDDRAILTLPGAVPTLTAADARAALDACPDVRHLHVSSLYLQPRLAADLATVLDAARRRGATTSLDTNDDPSGSWQHVDALLPHLDLLLPNRHEVLALARDTDPVNAAVQLAKAGPLVVVKDGANGALAADPTAAVSRAAASPRTVVDSTGAGDTFNAAFLDAWLSGRPLTECLRRGVLAGAESVTVVGGVAGQPTAAELLDLITAGRNHD